MGVVSTTVETGVEAVELLPERRFEMAIGCRDEDVDLECRKGEGTIGIDCVLGRRSVDERGLEPAAFVVEEDANASTAAIAFCVDAGGRAPSPIVPRRRDPVDAPGSASPRSWG